MKRSITTFLFLYVTTFCLSFVAHVIPWLNPIFFILYLLLFTVVSFRKLEYGFYALFASLFVDSFGYVFAWNGISLRIAMAGILMVFILIRLIRHRFDKTGLQDFLKFRHDKALYAVYVLLISWLTISFVHGWIQNGFSNAFFDANGFMFLLFLPSLLTVSLSTRTLITMLNAGLLWTFVLVSSIEVIFSRWGVVKILYTFIRDNRFGEITPAFGNFYRIFLQSEIYAVVGLLFALIGIFYSVIPAKAGIQTPKINTKRSFGFLFSFLDPESRFRMTNIGNYLLLFISVTILLINLSRSFWVGAGAAITILAIFLLRHSRAGGNPDKKTNTNRSFGFLFSFLDSVSKHGMTIKIVVSMITIFVLCIIYTAVISNTGLQTQQVVKDRITISEPAASSRKAQLGPLNSAIIKSPIVGYGFGKELEYQSSDPRRIDQSGGTGLVKTWAFELGWHDLIVKTGFIGSFLYISFILLLMRQLLKIPNHKHQITNKSQITSTKSQTDWGFGNWNLFGICNLEFVIYHLTIFLSLFALIIIHVFTPYLNHPLGIGVLLLALIGIQQNTVDSNNQGMVL